MLLGAQSPPLIVPRYLSETPNLFTRERSRVELTPTTSYQRLLVHRCSAYYKLVPENEPGSKGISVVAVSESRM